jgi:hypothetical protein
MSAKRNDGRINKKSHAGALAQKTLAGLKRLFPSYLLCFVPFLIFGSRHDFRLILWKIAVVGTGLLVFHYVRKSMFPYIDLKKSYQSVIDAQDKNNSVPLAIIVMAQSVLIASLALAVVFAVAGGL